LNFSISGYFRPEANTPNSRRFEMNGRESRVIFVEGMTTCDDRIPGAMVPQYIEETINVFWGNLPVNSHEGHALSCESLEARDWLPEEDEPEPNSKLSELVKKAVR
jgi:hypothetical protein